MVQRTFGLPKEPVSFSFSFSSIGHQPVVDKTSQSNVPSGSPGNLSTLTGSQ